MLKTILTLQLFILNLFVFLQIHLVETIRGCFPNIDHGLMSLTNFTAWDVVKLFLALKKTMISRFFN